MNDEPQEQGTIQRFGELETNPVSLPEEYCNQAIEQLNRDESNVYVL